MPDSAGHTGSIDLLAGPPVTSAELNTLFDASWPAHREVDFEQTLRHSLTYICAYQGERLVGFVKLAWDGGIHAFLLDTTVHPDLQRRGIGRLLVGRAAEEARARGIVWLHVDYEPHLDSFYAACGFVPTMAGLLRLAPA